jgi:hypothetical protein
LRRRRRQWRLQFQQLIVFFQQFIAFDVAQSLPYTTGKPCTVTFSAPFFNSQLQRSN